MLKVQEYLQYDGLGLAELVKSKQVSQTELLATAIQRCEQVNPKLNAVVIPMYETARKRAAQPLSGPFAGVPFLLKDLFQEYAGVPASHGCKGFKHANYIPDFNAEIVNRYLNAGVVVFGRTNSPEFGIKGITEPEAWGATHNPWNLKHNSGGSSGGSASAVAGGIVPIAAAGDGGGSIRIPASYCGLFGLKPSRGRTPWGPAYSEAMHGAAMQHVLSRSVRDSAAMLDATHGADAASLFKIQAPERPYLEEIKRAPRRLKIAFSTKSPIGTPVDKDSVQAIQHTARLLAQLGHEVVEDVPDIDGMALAKDFITTWFSQCAVTVENIKQQFGFADDAFELDTLALAAFGAQTSATTYINTQNRWGIYTHKLNLFLNKYDLFLIPSTASPAPKNGEIATPGWQKAVLKGLLKVGQAHHLAQGSLVDKMVRDNLRWVPFTQLANLTGVPAMSVPLYWTKKGLPIGSQFVASHGSEGMLLALAAQLEQAQPWQQRYKDIKL